MPYFIILQKADRKKKDLFHEAVNVLWEDYNAKPMGSIGTWGELVKANIPQKDLEMLVAIDGDGFEYPIIPAPWRDKMEEQAETVAKLMELVSDFG